MAHEILSLKLCELENQFSHLNNRIHLSETMDRHQLQEEMNALTQEYAATELALRKRLQRSRAKTVAILANTYGEIQRSIQKANAALQAQASSCGNPEDMEEEKILLAEYALDFATQAANRALLLSMKAIDAQRTQQETERRPS